MALTLTDESQQYGNIEETSVIARTPRTCINIWAGDHRQTPGGLKNTVGHFVAHSAQEVRRYVFKISCSFTSIMFTVQSIHTYFLQNKKDRRMTHCNSDPQVQQKTNLDPGRRTQHMHINIILTASQSSIVGLMRFAQHACFVGLGCRRGGRTTWISPDL